jgi:hypothetical protein
MKDHVALCGVEGAGKTTAADHFRARGFMRYSIADPMKMALQALFDIDDEYLWGHKKGDIVVTRTGINLGVTARDMMQKFGTWGRHDMLTMMGIPADPDKTWWVRMTEAKLNGTLHRCVVDDMRYPDEFNMLSKMATTVKIRNRTQEEATGDHASSTNWQAFQCDHEIHNDYDRGINQKHLNNKLRKVYTN